MELREVYYYHQAVAFPSLTLLCKEWTGNKKGFTFLTSQLSSPALFVYTAKQPGEQSTVVHAEPQKQVKQNHRQQKHNLTGCHSFCMSALTLCFTAESFFVSCLVTRPELESLTLSFLHLLQHKQK